MELEEVARRQGGVVTLAQSLTSGLAPRDVRSAVGRGAWRRVDRAVYLVERSTADAAGVPRSTAIRAAVLSLGSGAVAVYDTAAELYGLVSRPVGADIHVSVPARLAKRRADRSVRVHQLHLLPDAVGAVNGIAATTPIRTIADLVCRLDRFGAVSLLDSALYLDLINGDQLAAVPAMIRRRRGAVAARAYLAEADGRAESPLETRVRLRCVDGGVPPDDLQHRILDRDGRLLAVADAAWPGRRVALEADGQGPHSAPEAIYRDRWRQNRLADAGWRVLRFTWPDTIRRDYIPHVVRAALRAT